MGACRHLPTGSSPGVFDVSTGTYAAQDIAFDADRRSLTFNVVHWLAGEDAHQAWVRDHPDDPDGPPNDYYIVDSSKTLRSAPVADDAPVYLTHLATDGSPEVEQDSLDALGKYLRTPGVSDTFWITMSRGHVAELCEQYRP